VSNSNSFWWETALRETPLQVKNRRAYFIEVPADAAVDTQDKTPQSGWSNMRQHHYRWLKETLQAFPDNRRIIDVGCGPGQFTDLIENHDCCGIDFYPYPNVNIIADISQMIPLEDDSADIAILSNVLEHVYDFQTLLKEIHRVLCPGGSILIVVPFMIKLHQQPYDFFRYTRHALECIGNEAGFADIQVDELGNFFDVWDIDQRIRTRIILREAKGWRHFMARVLMWEERKCNRILLKLLPHGITCAPDEDGFPQSYGMIGRKP
jgi:SAM-dependent methyltransferase